MKKVICILLVILLLLTLVGCSRKKTEDKGGYVITTLNLNATKISTGILSIVIKEKNLLQPLLPDDVKITWHELTTDSDFVSLAMSGRLDIFGLSAVQFITSVENDLPVRLLSNHATITAQLLSTKDSINSIYDLTEKSKITISGLGSAFHFAFLLRCKELLNDPMRFRNNLIVVPFPENIGLMQTSKEYDAFIMVFPTLHKIPDSVNYKIIDNLTQTAYKYSLGSYIVTTEEFYKNNPVIIEAYLKARDKALDLVINNTEEIAVLLSSPELFDIEPEHIVTLIQENPPSLGVSGYDDIANLLFEMGVLRSPPKKFSSLPYYDEIPKK